MERLFAWMILGGVVLLQIPEGHAQSGQGTTAQPAAQSSKFADDLPGLPPPPDARSTVFGGVIREIDPIRDEFKLDVHGERPLKILFDQRTEIYRDGARIPLRDFKPAEYASVETALDGTAVFAVSIHILSGSPEGEYEGRVLSYNRSSGELTIGSSAAREPFHLLVQAGTSIVRQGQSAFSSAPSGSGDLAVGTLIFAKFQSDNLGHAVAHQIAILAVPGSSFIFAGTISSLDVHAGRLVVTDPRDQKEYEIRFDPGITPSGANLHLGDRVRINAVYDGVDFRASAIAAN